MWLTLCIIHHATNAVWHVSVYLKSEKAMLYSVNLKFLCRKVEIIMDCLFDQACRGHWPLLVKGINVSTKSKDPSSVFLDLNTRNVLSVPKYFSYQRKQEYCLWQTALSLTVQHRGGKGEARLHGDGDGGSCDVGGNFAQHMWRSEDADVRLGVHLQRVRDAILKSPFISQTCSNGHKCI